MFFSAIPNVLLVEDNAIALHLIETIATEAGLRFISAVNGEDALSLAKSHAFDLIITDIGLPGISGYELTHSIRQWEMTHLKKPTPIIGLTALAIHEAKTAGVVCGMNSLICKPINLNMFRALLVQYLPQT